MDERNLGGWTMIGRRMALLIANDEFVDPTFQRLTAPEQDASILETLLKDPDLCNFYVKTLVNRTSYEVNQAIEEFYADSTRTDLLLLFFSGHGIKDEEGKLYFVTRDTRQNRLRTTAIPSSLINEGMRGSRSRRQILILDCCYSGAFAKGMIAKSGSPIGSSIGSIERFQGRGRVILTASDAMQYAFEEDSLVQGSGVHSIFSSAIIDGLRSFRADENKDGVITIDELYDYVDEYVTDRTPDQRPSIWTYDVQGEMIIATKPPTLPEVPEAKVVTVEPPKVTEAQILAPQPEEVVEPDSSELVEAPPEPEKDEIVEPDITDIEDFPPEPEPEEVVEHVSTEIDDAPPEPEPVEEPMSEVLGEEEKEEITVEEAKGPSSIPTWLMRIFAVLGGLCFILYLVMYGEYLWVNALPVVGAGLLVMAFVFRQIGGRLAKG